MQVSRTLYVGLAGLVVAVGGAAAMAVPITFQMQGTITSVDDIQNLTGVVVGDTWTLDWTFDSGAPDTEPAPDFGVYAIDTMFLDIGGNSFNPVSPGGPPIAVGNGAAQDSYRLEGFPSFAGAGEDAPIFRVELFDDQATVFSDDSLPLAPPDLSEFETRLFRLDDLFPNVTLIGTITSFTPEPATLSLLALGGLLLTRRRR